MLLPLCDMRYCMLPLHLLHFEIKKLWNWLTPLDQRVKKYILFLDCRTFVVTGNWWNSPFFKSDPSELSWVVVLIQSVHYIEHKDWTAGLDSGAIWEIPYTIVNQLHRPDCTLYSTGDDRSICTYSMWAEAYVQYAVRILLYNSCRGVMFFGRGCALVRIRVSIEFEKEKKIYIPEKKIG